MKPKVSKQISAHLSVYTTCRKTPEMCPLQFWITLRCKNACRCYLLADILSVSPFLMTVWPLLSPSLVYARQNTFVVMRWTRRMSKWKLIENGKMFWMFNDDILCRVFIKRLTEDCGLTQSHHSGELNQNVNKQLLPSVRSVEILPDASHHDMTRIWMGIIQTDISRITER